MNNETKKNNKGWTEERRQKLSISVSGKNNPMYGKKHPKELQQRINKNIKLAWKNKTEEEKRKINEKHKQTWANKPEEEKKKLAEAIGRRFREYYKTHVHHNKGIHFSEEHKEKIRQGNIGWQHSEESKKKMREAQKGKIISEEARKKLSIAKTGTKLSEETKKKIGAASKRLWKTEEYRRKVFNTRPTGLEKKFIGICKQYNFPFKYTGDGSFAIGYKVPDFVDCNGKKVCVEVFYDYFKKKDHGSVKNYKTQRAAHFAKYGWKTVFFDQEQVSNEDIMLQELSKFGY